MNPTDPQLRSIQSRIRDLEQRELRATNRTRKLGYRCFRRMLLLYFEYRRDEVGLRAESLSYFTLFSLLPLFVGFFILFGFLGQWAPVQAELQLWIEKVLSPMPVEHRQELIQFVMQFKSDYLERLQQQSSSVGVFALLILVWIGSKVYFNIENLLNKIWNVPESRDGFRRVQNFVFVGVLAPTLATIVLTLPAVLHQFAGITLGFWFNHLLQDGLLFLGLLFVYRFFPNTRVDWKSAFWGALFATGALFFASVLFQIYFEFGTTSIYGKLAVLPIFALLVYGFWLLFILGAEVSFLAQQPATYSFRALPVASLSDGLVLLELMKKLELNFETGEPPLSLSEWSQLLQIPEERMERVIRFLLKKGVVYPTQTSRQKHIARYHLAKKVRPTDLIELIQDYLELDVLSQRFDLDSLIMAINRK